MLTNVLLKFTSTKVLKVAFVEILELPVLIVLIVKVVAETTLNNDEGLHSLGHGYLS